jgi:hypothetical protein
MFSFILVLALGAVFHRAATLAAVGPRRLSVRQSWRYRRTVLASMVLKTGWQ